MAIRAMQEDEEMVIRAILFGVAFSSLPIVGCGTVANLVVVHPDKGGKSPFGGVRQDVDYINSPPSAQHPQAAKRLLCTVDVPFSLIGDVVTWPYTAAYTCINQPVPVPAMIDGPFQTVPQAPALAQPPVYPLENLPAPGRLPSSEPGKQP